MYFLNLSNLSLPAIKKSISLLFCLFLCACSSTGEINNNYFSDNGYARGFISENFNTHFTAANKDIVKKPLSSDHQLMMSLLNRTMTGDQAMMMAFAQQRTSYGSSFSNYAVEIKGDKSLDTSDFRARNDYTKLISQDMHAVRVGAPQ